MQELRLSPLLTHLNRRRFLQLSGVALAAPALRFRTARAAEESWYLSFKETTIWTKARGTGSAAKLERAPQWTYFKGLGAAEGDRLPVAHPLTADKVYVDAEDVGPAGPPTADWVYVPIGTTAAALGPQSSASPSASPSPTATTSPTPVGGPSVGAWIAASAPTELWSAQSDGIYLGLADPGSLFKVLEAPRSGRLRVLDAITNGPAYLDAKTVAPAGPPTGPRVPARWWGYVGVEGINVRTAPDGSGESLGTLPVGTPLVVESWVVGQEVISDQPGWARVAEGVYAYGPLLRKPYIELPPAPIHGPLGDRWIDTNLTQQTVTAYEGSRPVYMTATCSGRPGWETHEGVHSILWRKERETMDSNTLVGQDAARASYKIENIRWTQYFTNDGQAIHENFWRDPALFGIPSSHGCLGMIDQDALWFWLWANQGTPISVHY
jgi:hypothetical protein